MEELNELLQSLERGLSNIDNIDYYYNALTEQIGGLGQMFLIIAVVTFVVMAFNFWKINKKVDNLEEMLEKLLEVNAELETEASKWKKC